MTTPSTPARPAWLVLLLYWGSLLVSLTFPWALLVLFEVSAHRRTATEALHYMQLHFFAPGYNFFLIGLLSAAPFAVGAVFLLFHLGWNTTLDSARYAKRLAGVAGGLLLMFGVSFWTHLSALMYPDAQGAIIYLFLPFILLVLLPIGYGAGRLASFLLGAIRRNDEDLA